MQRLSIPLLAATLGFAAFSCNAPTNQPSSAGAQAAQAAGEFLPLDEHSLSNPNEVRVTHVDLDLDLDFDAKRMEGEARLELMRYDPSAPLVLDTQALRIIGVLGEDGRLRSYELGEEQGRMGRPLTIELEPGDDAVRVRYATTDGGEALQWLAPEQTAGRQQPFLFTQGQAILTRSWIPLQDSPGVRISYSARVNVPEALTAVMSAESEGVLTEGAAAGRRVFRFGLELPIPSYLIALAVGDLAEAKVSERCSIWAEPSVLPTAAAEFEDTESMIQAAEGIFGEYRWGRYDVLVLPPAFPYGGMENPLLTFATPTVLAGDKSLVALIAHELAHSWSGNLVTNATWRDFWLNEGFTVYFEKRIMETVYGMERADMERALDWDGLQGELADLEPWQTVLHIDLAGHHPDDGFSGVPYDKGNLFLMRMEEVVGREALDEFLSAWFDAHASELDAKEWNTQAWLRFLKRLPTEPGSVPMADLDEAFQLTAAGNSEILAAWLELGIRQQYEPSNARLEKFLMDVGRRKFLSPLYKALMETPEGATRARAIYTNARPRYHAVSAQTLDGIVN